MARNPRELILRSVLDWAYPNLDRSSAATLTPEVLMHVPCVETLYSSEEQNFKSLWLHVTSTNGLLLLIVFRVLQRFPGPWWEYRSSISESTPESTNRVQFFYDSFPPSPVAPGDSYLNYRELLRGPGCSSRQMAQNCAAIVFPFLTVSTDQTHDETRKDYKKMRETLSTRVSAEYSADCTVHLTRTLDEAYYPGLSAPDLEIKNRDQVISRYPKTVRSYSAESKPIDVVPQLWLWRMGNTIVSACSIIQKSTIFRHENTNVDKKSLNWTPLPRTCDADLQLSLIIAGYIENFGKETIVEDIKFPPILSMFETCLISVLSDVTRYMENRSRDSISYPQEKSFIHSLADIQSELAIMRDVFDQQEEVLNVVFKARPKAQGGEGDFTLMLDGLNEEELKMREETIKIVKIIEAESDGWVEVERARITLANYRRRVDKIDSDAQRIDKEVQNMLNLKRTYASVKDARTSVLISTAVIGFTVVTIIFAPLAFLTALFALKIEGFERLRINTTSEIYKSGYMGGIFVGSEILTIALTCVTVALSLWYLEKWDSDKEKANSGEGQANSGKTSLPNVNNARSNQKVAVTHAAKVKGDIESQQQ